MGPRDKPEGDSDEGWVERRRPATRPAAANQRTRTKTTIITAHTVRPASTWSMDTPVEVSCRSLDMTLAPLSWGGALTGPPPLSVSIVKIRKRGPKRCAESHSPERIPQALEPHRKMSRRRSLRYNGRTPRETAA